VEKITNKGLFLGEVELLSGKKYIIQPDNPRKMKHRNRICILIEVDDNFMPTCANVKFEDTNRIGKIDCLSDLKNIKS